MFISETSKYVAHAHSLNKNDKSNKQESPRQFMFSSVYIHKNMPLPINYVESNEYSNEITAQTAIRHFFLLIIRIMRTHPV